MAESFLLRDVSAGPSASPTLQSVSVDVPCVGVTALAGPSGAGKSSLLRLLNRLDDPTAGSITWHGTDLVDLDPIGLRRRVGMVFQRPPVFPGSVFDNLRVASPALDEAGGATALARVGLDGDLLARQAVDLSGGEAQRMCFARALLTEPEILLADEPTASLDGAARDTLESLAATLVSAGMPMVWVSHDVEQLRRLADHVIVLAAGRVVASGALATLDGHDDPVVRASVGAR